MQIELLSIAAKKYFPTFKVKYKTQSSFMKFLATLMFFNKDFMTHYTTTVGNTVYVPDENYLTAKPINGAVILMHELVHVYDSKKIGNVLFKFLYLCPQILFLLAPLLFLVNLKLVAVVAALCLFPIPAYFRMYFERRAYLSSFYTLHLLGKKIGFTPMMDAHKKNCLKQFKTSSYYWMWTFKSLDKQFDDAMMKVENNERPFDDLKLFEMLEDFVESM